MEANLLLEQYGRYKKQALEESPYRCLLHADIELNPHQINAFCAAVQALKTGGIILADEVGLGKTIEAGLVLRYVLDAGAKRVLIALPATLRKQWEIELDEKFSLKATILDRLAVKRDYYFIKKKLESDPKPQIVIASYDYASKLMKQFPAVKWDFLIIDEAHNLRNVFHSAKRAKSLYDMTKGIPKILLTATPLQNALTDLHGVVSFIDPRIFGSEKVFVKRYTEEQNYEGLKQELRPVLYRTLRRDVSSYMAFRKRECRTIDFKLTPEEIDLYMLVNNYLKRPVIYAIPTANQGLITLVIRKLLASSSFALIETFEILAARLEKLKEGTRSADAQEGFDLFWSYVEDEQEEEDAEDEEDEEDEDIEYQKQLIQEELDEVNNIIAVARRITRNAKITALGTALDTAFSWQKGHGLAPKAVVFTESKRTQKYIAGQLRDNGWSEDDILLFNGDFDDVMSKEIYRAWRVKNYKRANYGRSVEYKHAIVDYFKDHAKILIVTDAGSEGLNLQFCNTIINYDLPWNPQKIEQRIGRCHRYGQKNDVVAINLLNTENAADKRVYEILSRKFELFDGVFGASDIALGALESGVSFERSILEIYQRCNSSEEFKKAFDKLDRKLEAKRNKKATQLRNIPFTESSEAKQMSLEKTKREIDRYLRDVQYWSEVEATDASGNLQYWKINNWGMECFGSHGTLFLGTFCNGNKQLFPVMLLCDENGEYIDFEEEDIVHALEQSKDEDIHFFTPSQEEEKLYASVYEHLTAEMIARYEKTAAPVRAYNRHKLENWATIQNEQLVMEIQNIGNEIIDLDSMEDDAKEFLEKIDIRKRKEEKLKRMEQMKKAFHQKCSDIQAEAEREIAAFDKQLQIQPLLYINVVLKF